MARVLISMTVSDRLQVRTIVYIWNAPCAFVALDSTALHVMAADRDDHQKNQPWFMPPSPGYWAVEQQARAPVAKLSWPQIWAEYKRAQSGSNRAARPQARAPPQSNSPQARAPPQSNSRD